MLGDEKNISSTRAICLLLLIGLLCLVPFLNKAFHIDDPVYIWTAQHIQTHPLDFCGLSMNWYGTVEPLSKIQTNPPLVSYYIALVAYWFGWSEIVLHLAFLVPACAVIVGTYLLAQDLCDKPFMAALATVCTPVFIISSTTLMCDVLMLSFWVFAVYFWRRGLRSDNYTLIAIASLLITLSSLTKYFGINLIPLLLAYSFFEKRKSGVWMLFLLIPVSCLGLYEWITYHLYGVGQIQFASSFSMASKKIQVAQTVENIVTGFSFLGGCILISFFYSLVYWLKFKWAINFLLISLILIVMMQYGVLSSYPIANADGINWVFVAQLPLFVFAGTSFIFVVSSDLLRNRDSDSLLLFLWVLGTFVFTIFVNWSVNGRSILPIAPVAGMIMVRYLSQSNNIYANDKRGLYGPLVPTLLIALIVANADYGMANSARIAAHAIHDSINKLPGKIWFEGHWGFQYYMERMGGEALDYENPLLKKGDLVVIPSNNSNTKPLFNHLVTLEKTFAFDGAKLFSTMNINTGAGFYSDKAGPLPYAIGNNTEKYYLFKMIADKKTRFTY